MTALVVMQQLAATSSRADQEQVMFGAFIQGEIEFFIGARLALDPLVTFGITKVAEIVEDDGAPGDFDFAEFVALANSLWRRKLTGEAARAEINAAANRCHAPTWNLFYRPILLKKFVALATSINRVLDKLQAAYPEAKDQRIPVFGCQMPHDAALHPNKLHGRKCVDTKLSGARVLSILDTEVQSVSQFTIKGKIVDKHHEVQAGLRALLPKLPGSMVLDGVMLRDQKYAVIDVLPLMDFRAGHCAVPQHERHALLAAMQECGLWQTTQGHIFVVPQIEVDLDTEAGRSELHEFQRQAAANGFEAIMLKDAMAPYTLRRSSAWLQLRCSPVAYCQPAR